MKKMILSILLVISLFLIAGCVKQASEGATEKGALAGQAVTTASLPSGIYYGCREAVGSTSGWGTNLYSTIPTVLTNSVTVSCNPGEGILINHFTCNPRFWYQKLPVYVSAVSLTGEGRTLTCTGGESQGILNVLCCKKS
ncbi:hypothetical protein HYU21_04850 [Candidatus Woesearchaeota archaeon]|nr:hypothetical protein [Candidatus Woesearchaeota archaeon]